MGRCSHQQARHDFLLISAFGDPQSLMLTYWHCFSCVFTHSFWQLVSQSAKKPNWQRKQLRLISPSGPGSSAPFIICSQSFSYKSRTQRGCFSWNALCLSVLCGEPRPSPQVTPARSLVSPGEPWLTCRPVRKMSRPCRRDVMQRGRTRNLNTQSEVGEEEGMMKMRSLW